MNDARRHLASAATVAESDPRLAVAAAHDAIRKAITAYMDAGRLRAQGGEGARAVVIEYARYALANHLDEATLNAADGLRALRNQAEYSDLASRIDTRAAISAIAVAEQVVRAVMTAMKTGRA